MGGEIGCSAEGMECISSRIHKHLYQHMHGLSLAGIIWIRSNLPILQLFSHKNCDSYVGSRNVACIIR